MNKSESIVKLSAALVKAQANIGGAVKDAQNPHFRSRFADLGEIMLTCKPSLLEQGIIVMQHITTTDTGPGLETMLLHESGEWISSTMPIVCAKQNDPQAFGSAVTYARRYSLQSTLFIAAVDDDAEAAMYRDTKPQPAVPAPVVLPMSSPEIKRIDGIIHSVEERKLPGKTKPVFDVTIVGPGANEKCIASTFNATDGNQAKAFAADGTPIIAGVEVRDGKPWVLKTLEEAADVPF